jgi:D-inositol-3-phosphate glycosyltransferase
MSSPLTFATVASPDLAAAPRVALVELFGIGGTADYTDCLARALAARGIRVAVITSSLYRPLGPNPPYEIFRPFTYSPDQPKPWKAWQLARAIGPARAQLRAFRPDVIHAQGTVLPALERRLYRGLPGVRVCTVHDALAHEWRPWIGSFTGFYRGFDRLICHSESTARRVRSAIPHARIDVVPHGRYTPLVTTLPDRALARRDLGLPPTARVVLFFGFIRRYKGLDLFLDALQLARAKGHDLHGLVAGRALYDVGRSIDRAARQQLPVSWALRFIPNDEIPMFFAAADVVALPYVDTSDSGAFELAAAFGKPVVATDAGGLAEAFARYGHGALVPERTAPALTEALLRTYSSTPAMTESNSWDAVAARTDAIYREATDG